MSKDYSIKLGINFDDKELKDIRTRLNSLTDNTHRIRIDIDNSRLLKQIEHAKKELRELNKAKGNQPSLTVNTQSLEKSLNRVADIVDEVRRSLGTLDNKAGMQSLLTSVNQIATALGKVENESDSLLKSLSALSKKDFSVNFDLKMGKSASQISSEQGDIKRDAISQLKQQAKALEDYLDQYYKVKQKQEGVVKLTQGTSLFSTFWEMSPNIGNTKQSLKEQVSAYKRYIDLMQEAAKIKGVDLGGITSGFSKTTNDIVEETKKVSDGAEEVKQALKGIFGGSLDVEGLSGQLQPIITDLGEIKVALQSLSSNNSIDGLTQSFNRLSETLENLTNNLTLAKNTLDTGFSNASPANNAVKAAQQTGQKIGEAIGKSATQSAKQTLNIDDVVEKETRALMKEYGISVKNKTAKDDIKGALTNYVNEIKSGGTIVNDELFGSFNTADAALRKVTDSIARHKKEVVELDTLYEDLLVDIKSVNNGKGATKVRLSDMRAEWGDDYKANKDLLGSWFSDKYTDGIGIDSWAKSKNWSSLFDLSGSHQDIANQLVELVKKAKTKTSYSGDELFKEGFLNIDDVEASVKESAANISAAQQKIAQSSVESANATSQAETQRQQAYEETRQKLEEVNKAIAEHNDTITDPSKMASLGDMDSVQAYMDELDALEQKKKEIESTLNSLGKSDAGQVDIANDFNEAEIEIGQAEDKIESLRNALKSLGIGDAAVDNIIKDFEKLDVTVKKVTGRLNDNGSMKLTVKGVNNDGDTITQTTNINADNTIGSWSKSVTKGLSEAEQKLQRLKTVTKEINGLKVDLFKFEDAGNIERATNQLNELENEAAELRATLQQKYNITSFDEIDDIARQGEESLNSLIAKTEEVKTKLAKSIKADIEIGNVDNQMDAMLVKFNGLSDANDDLRNSVNTVKQAYEKMLAAASANTGDEVADRERLIQAEKEFAAALGKTNNLIKQQARADRIYEANERLADSHKSLELDMVNWLKKNSKAAKEYEGQIYDLIESLRKLEQAGNLQDIDIRSARRKFNNWDKEAESKNLKGLTLFDQVKEKFKEYSAYFSVAEVFMYAEQALRSMFNTVLEIDTAMTGLYRVTDLTAAQYDLLFNDMISSAKEYGATLNDIINATTDWVRAGFDADVALGMAEVTTMYQHISDLDYDTAAENLITAYNGFKNELLGLYDGDEVAAVNYIADVLNELDNNFAVTSAGLGEALKRSASALDLAGNSIQETAGMITGIAEVTQDPEKAGKMYARTYSNVWCNYQIA